MADETERKFLVTGDSWRSEAIACRHIVQAYLALTDKLEIRVRIIDGETANLTIKSAESNLSRREFEYEMPVADAEALLEMRLGRCIRKQRYIVPLGKGLQWEVDVFEGELEGLCLAEVELKTGEEELAEFNPPEWLGHEVTGDSVYYNASLASEDLSGQR